MKRAAFTLVELLVVIAIIGLLSTVAVISLSSARIKARDTKRFADIRQITTAMQMYKEDNGTYPAPATLGCSGGNGVWYCLGHGNSGTCWSGGTYSGCTAIDNALAPYIVNIPDDPENAVGYNGDAYLYNYTSNLGTAVAPLVHWGIEQVGNSTTCNGGAYGQWAATGRNHWWCAVSFP